MAFERRIAFAVFAVGVLLVAVVLVGCGGGDDSTREAAPQGQSPVSAARQSGSRPPNRPRVPRHCKEGTRSQAWIAARFYDGRTRLRLGYLNGGNEPCAARVGYGRPAYIAKLRVATREGEWLDVIGEHCVDVILPEAAPKGSIPLDLGSDRSRDLFRLTASERDRLVAPGQTCPVIAGDLGYG